MDLLPLDLLRYAEKNTTSPSALLNKIDRDTHAQVMKPRMLSGHLQGRMLSMISKMINPRFILEIGTYTGYSALCLAEGLQADGVLITIDVNEELEQRVRQYFSESEYEAQIDYRIGNALDILPTLSYPFDLIFIDADKENYGFYYNLMIDKLRPGTFILADNVLWSGKVLDEKKDKDTRAIHKFNEQVQADPRIENVLIPIRDGIMLMRKR
jgi:predicted O-methyltransferase YrrM